MDNNDLKLLKSMVKSEKKIADCVGIIANKLIILDKRITKLELKKDGK